MQNNQNSQNRSSGSGTGRTYQQQRSAYSRPSGAAERQTRPQNASRSAASGASGMRSQRSQQPYSEGVRQRPGNAAPQRRSQVKRTKRPSGMGPLLIALLIFAAILIIICVSVALSSAKKNPGFENTETTGNISTEPSETTGENTEPPDTDSPKTTEPPATETSEPYPQIPEITFKSDLSAYEEYMNPTDDSEYLILINTENTLDSTYKPNDLTALVDTRQDGRAVQYMRKNAAMAMEAMCIEARACGCKNLSVTSAYRSYEYQKQLFDNRVNQYLATMPYDEAYKKAATINAIPGTSEHQSGLCADIHNISTGANVSFADTAEGAWLAENSWKFGFILRYPKDKTELTGITFEPWHFRYVGRKAAYEIWSNGWCLEEYFEHHN
ncbi:MAG: M15 family metallopeptidase [Firmicutes bacterium]|nr:M15 family metallopeptidase [Bacillota bacterium]